MAVALAKVFTFQTTYEVTAETFPWSALVFGIGGLLASVASVMLGAIVLQWQKYGEYYQSEEKDFLDDNGRQMSDLRSKSYDRPRYPYNGTSADFYDQDRYDRHRDFASSKKYRDRDYDVREYDRSYQNRGYEADRSYDRNYDQGRNYDRNYDRTNNDRGYDYGGKAYSQTRSGDNMYRPYAQSYRY